MKNLIATLAMATLTTFSWASPPVAPFYEAASKMQPNGKLGQVLKTEKVKTSVPNAQAWKIAYVSPMSLVEKRLPQHW